MIARPKSSRNEWKTAELGAFEVGHVAPSSRPVVGGGRVPRVEAPADGEVVVDLELAHGVGDAPRRRAGARRREVEHDAVRAAQRRAVARRARGRGAAAAEARDAGLEVVGVDDDAAVDGGAVLERRRAAVAHVAAVVGHGHALRREAVVARRGRHRLLEARLLAARRRHDRAVDALPVAPERRGRRRPRVGEHARGRARVVPAAAHDARDVRARGLEESEEVFRRPAGVGVAVHVDRALVGRQEHAPELLEPEAHRVVHVQVGHRGLGRQHDVEDAEVVSDVAQRRGVGDEGDVRARRHGAEARRGEDGLVAAVRDEEVALVRPAGEERGRQQQRERAPHWCRVRGGPRWVVLRFSDVKHTTHNLPLHRGASPTNLPLLASCQLDPKLFPSFALRPQPWPPRSFYAAASARRACSTSRRS